MEPDRLSEEAEAFVEAGAKQVKTLALLPMVYLDAKRAWELKVRAHNDAMAILVAARGVTAAAESALRSTMTPVQGSTTITIPGEAT